MRGCHLISCLLTTSSLPGYALCDILRRNVPFDKQPASELLLARSVVRKDDEGCWDVGERGGWVVYMVVISAVHYCERVGSGR